MDQTKSLSSGKNYFIQYSPQIDFATFLVSGLLLATWINDPVSKSGAVFASLLNAAILGIGNKVAKTEESQSSVYKTAVTIGCLMCSGFAGFYSASFLKGRIGVLLSLTSSLQISGINLAVKIGSHVLYFFCIKEEELSILAMPTKVEEILTLDKETLNRLLVTFQTVDGKESWKALPINLQLTFISQLIKENISIEGLVIDWRKIEDGDFTSYFETIWKVYSALEVIPENLEQILVMKSIYLDLPPPENVPNGFYRDVTFFFPDRLTKNQQIWFNNIEHITPSQKQKQLLIEISYWNNIPPKKRGFHLNVLFYFPCVLPMLKNDDEVKKLTHSQLEWYAIFLAGGKKEERWFQFSLEVQYALSQRLKEEYPEIGCPLVPKSSQEVEEASREIIENLNKASEMYWLCITREMQKQCNKRFLKESLEERKVYVESTHEVEQLSSEELSSYNQILRFFGRLGSHNPFFDQFSGEVVKTLSKRFIALKMGPPSLKFNEIFIPSTKKEFAELEDYQCEWLDNYFKANPTVFGNLDFSLQLTYFRTKTLLEQMPVSDIVLSIPTLKDIENIEDDFIGALSLYYKDRILDREALSLEVQNACNDLFKKVNDTVAPEATQRVEAPKLKKTGWLSSWW